MSLFTSTLGVFSWQEPGYLRRYCDQDTGQTGKSESGSWQESRVLIYSLSRPFREPQGLLSTLFFVFPEDKAVGLNRATSLHSSSPILSLGKYSGVIHYLPLTSLRAYFGACFRTGTSLILSLSYHGLMTAIWYVPCSNLLPYFSNLLQGFKLQGES